MIKMPLVYISLEEEERGFLEYVSTILKKLNLVPLILHSKTLLSDPIGYITQRQEEHSIYQQINKFVGNYFDRFETYVSFEGIEKVVDKLMCDHGVDMAFFRYKKQLFSKSLPEKVINSLQELKMWIYKDGCPHEITNLCIPVDFSERTLKQWDFLEYLKEHFSLNFRLVYALNVARLKNKLSPEEYQKLLKDKKDEAVHLLKEMFGDRELELDLLEEDPYNGLSKHINSENYNLILISKRGRGMAKFVGSVSQHLMRTVRCPLIVL